MLEVIHGLLTFPKYKVIYKQHGEYQEAYTNDKEWWLAFSRQWRHTEIIRFEYAEFSDEQHQRLKEVENLDEAYSHFAEEYALNGRFPDELTEEEGYAKEHPLKQLQLDKRDQLIGQKNTELEIENFMLRTQVQNLGQQNTGLELDIMVGKEQNAILGQQVTQLELLLLNKTEV